MDQKIYYRYGKTVMSVTAVIARCFCLFRKQEIGESEKKTINQPSEIETTGRQISRKRNHSYKMLLRAFLQDAWPIYSLAILL